MSKAWAENYVRVARGLPDRVTLDTLEIFGASTHGTRCLKSALNFFDRTLAKQGWSLVSDDTYTETWTGNGLITLSKAGEVRPFIIDGEYKLTLKEQWKNLL